MPLPRSTTALRWLQGQAPAGASGAPHVYFSPRHSSAPDTDGGRDAAAASAGSGAVAGIGAAWLWQVSSLFSEPMATCSSGLLLGTGYFAVNISPQYSRLFACIGCYIGVLGQRGQRERLPDGCRMEAFLFAAAPYKHHLDISKPIKD